MRGVCATVVLLLSLNGCWVATGDEVQHVAGAISGLDSEEVPSQQEISDEWVEAESSQQLLGRDGSTLPMDTFSDSNETAEVVVGAELQLVPTPLGDSDDDAAVLNDSDQLQCVSSCPDSGGEKFGALVQRRRHRARTCQVPVPVPGLKKACRVCNPCERCVVRGSLVRFRIASSFLEGDSRALTGVVISNTRNEVLYSRTTTLMRGIDYDAMLRGAPSGDLRITFLLGRLHTPAQPLARLRL